MIMPKYFKALPFEMFSSQDYNGVVYAFNLSLFNILWDQKEANSEEYNQPQNKN